MKSIPYGRQNITDEDIRSVVKTLQSDYLTQGPVIEEFENKFAQFVGSEFAVAVANGTAALHLCAMAMNVKKESKVITTPITFAASANCVRYCGGSVDFVDIDPKTYLMDLYQLENKLKNAGKNEYAGIIPVDFAGYPVNMEKLKSIADKYGCWIIEDACHAPGGYFIDSTGEKQYCGNNEYSDLSIFSFHPVKHFATGEGGIITTNNVELYNKIKLLRTHGITKDPDLLKENHGGWYYEMQELGYNYRLTDIQCALGISQLERADQNLERRNEIAINYDSAFKNIKIKTPFRDTNVFHAFHLYIIQIDNRRELYDYLREHGIFAQVHYIPLHLQPYYQKLGWKKGDFPVSELYYEKCLSLPMFHTLSMEDQQYTIDIIINFLQQK